MLSHRKYSLAHDDAVSGLFSIYHDDAVSGLFSIYHWQPALLFISAFS